MSTTPFDPCCLICERPLTPAERLSGRTCEQQGCRDAYRRHLAAGAPLCAACGRPLSGPGSQLVSHCGRPACRAAASAASGPSAQGDDHRARCVVCQQSLPGREIGEQVCDDPLCRHLAASLGLDRQSQEYERRCADLVAAALERRAAEVAAEQAVQPSPLPAEEYRLTLTPQVEMSLCAAPVARRERFTAHLEGLLDSVAERRETAEPAAAPALAPAGDPALQQLFGACCAVCGGKCCQRGGDTAYLRVETIERFWDQSPELTRDEVRSAYLDLLPATAYDGSCVYHGPSGCGLTAAMRSNTCNTYFCGGLQELRNAVEKGAPRRAYVVSSHDFEIVATRLIDLEPRETT